MRTGRASRWPLYVGAAAPATIVAVASLLDVAKRLEFALALAAIVLVVLLRVGRRRALIFCVVAASFFAGAPLKAGLDVSDLFLLTALAFLLLEPDRTGATVTPPRLLLAGVGLLILGGFIGGLFQPSVDPYRAYPFPYPKTFLFFPPRIGEGLRFAWGTVGVILLIRACRLTRRHVEVALMAYGLGATVSVIWALFGAGRSTGRAQGLTAHPVAFGLISAFAAIVAVGLLLSQRRAGRPLAVLILAAGVTGIALSGTRAAVLVLVVGLVILQFGLRSLRRTAVFVLLAPLALALAILGGGGATPVGIRLAGSASAELSNSGRALLRTTAETVAQHHGVTGIGFRYFFPPHNLFLAVLSAAGVIGLAGLIIVVVSLVSRLAVTRGPPAQAAIAGALAIYASFWVLNPGWDRWLWIPIALACAAGPAAERHTPDDDGASRRHRLARASAEGAGHIT